MSIRMDCMHVIVIEGITDVLQVFSQTALMGIKIRYQYAFHLSHTHANPCNYMSFMNAEY